MIGRREGGSGPAGIGPAGAPPPPDWTKWVEQSCRTVELAGQWRAPRTFDALGPAGELVTTRPSDGRGGGCSTEGTVEVVSFASNDYLGLSAHPEVIDAAHRALDRWGSGSGASRLVTGSRPVHDELEQALASWKGCDRAVVFPTGFAANLSVLSVFATEGAHIFSDELNHASIIDGCRMARGAVSVFPHGDLDRLDGMIAASQGRPIIVTDSVFSMDGDCAHLEGLVEVAGRHGALLVLDEAHAVLGPELPVGAQGRVEVLRMGTLSKALGSLGGFVAGPSRFIELLVNRARPYIFSTAPTPANAAAALAAVGIVRSDQGAALRRRLCDLVDRLTAAVGQVGHGGAPIVPVVIGAEADAMSASSELLARGQWVPAIRPPTVPLGTSRLRITLSAVHSDAQVDGLIDGLAALGLAHRPARTTSLPVPPTDPQCGRAGSRSGAERLSSAP